MKRIDFDFYRGKKVLVTGHTGFKGTWLCRILALAGADVLGYSRGSEKNPDFFAVSGVKNHLSHVTGDVRDFSRMYDCFRSFRPEIVIHLAAQPIVLEGYALPRYTYETNVLGTVNLMECVRTTDSVRSVLNVTTDKVYRDGDKPASFVEGDPLDGYDPYSNSKSCSELVTRTYIRSYFGGPSSPAPAVSTARAGNVIGGGDFAKDRIIPECVRAVSEGVPVRIRNPQSVRPFQHVLEALSVYLMIAQGQYEDGGAAGAYNVGPDAVDCITTGELVGKFCSYWGGSASWEYAPEYSAPHEAEYLQLDCDKLKKTFDWSPRWHIDDAIRLTCKFHKIWLEGGDITAEMDREIEEFSKDEI